VQCREEQLIHLEPFLFRDEYLYERPSKDVTSLMAGNTKEEVIAECYLQIPVDLE